MVVTVDVGVYLQPKTISPKVFNNLKKLTERLNPHQRTVILTFNEFPFKYFARVPSGAHSNGEKVPTHVLIICIRFVHNKMFHLLGSLFYYTSYRENDRFQFSKDISECMKLYILALRNIDLHVVATVAPFTPTFSRAIHILGQVPYLEEYLGAIMYDVGNIKNIIHIHDPYHVEQMWLRSFMDNDCYFNYDGSDLKASLACVLEALRLDNKPLIKKDPISSNWTDSALDYYFSKEVGEYIDKLHKRGILPLEALGTTAFIKIRDIAFNCYYGNYADGQFLRLDQVAINEFMDVISSMKIIDHRLSKQIEPTYSQTEYDNSNPSESVECKNAKNNKLDLSYEIDDTPDLVENKVSVSENTPTSISRKNKKKKRNSVPANAPKISTPTKRTEERSPASKCESENPVSAKKNHHLSAKKAPPKISTPTKRTEEMSPASRSNGENPVSVKKNSHLSAKKAPSISEIKNEKQTENKNEKKGKVNENKDIKSQQHSNKQANSKSLKINQTTSDINSESKKIEESITNNADHKKNIQYRGLQIKENITKAIGSEGEKCKIIESMKKDHDLNVDNDDINEMNSMKSSTTPHEKDINEMKRSRTPEDFEISEVLIMLSGQSVTDKKVENLDESKKIDDSHSENGDFEKAKSFPSKQPITDEISSQDYASTKTRISNEVKTSTNTKDKDKFLIDLDEIKSALAEMEETGGIKAYDETIADADIFHNFLEDPDEVFDLEILNKIKNLTDEITAEIPEVPTSNENSKIIAPQIEIDAIRDNDRSEHSKFNLPELDKGEVSVENVHNDSNGAEKSVKNSKHVDEIVIGAMDKTKDSVDKGESKEDQLPHLVESEELDKMETEIVNESKVSADKYESKIDEIPHLVEPEELDEMETEIVHESKDSADKNESKIDEIPHLVESKELDKMETKIVHESKDSADKNESKMDGIPHLVKSEELYKMETEIVNKSKDSAVKDESQTDKIPHSVESEELDKIESEIVNESKDSADKEESKTDQISHLVESEIVNESKNIADKDESKSDQIAQLVESGELDKIESETLNECKDTADKDDNKTDQIPHLVESQIVNDIKDSADKDESKSDQISQLNESGELDKIESEIVNECKDSADKDENETDQIPHLVESKELDKMETKIVNKNKDSAVKDESETDNIPHSVESEELDKIESEIINESKDSADKDKSKTDQLPQLVESEKLYEIESEIVNESKDNADKDESKTYDIPHLVESEELYEIESEIVNECKDIADKDDNKTDQIPHLVESEELDRIESQIVNESKDIADKDKSRTDENPHLVESEQLDEIGSEIVNESKNISDKDENKTDQIPHLVESEELDRIESQIVNDIKDSADKDESKSDQISQLNESGELDKIESEIVNESKVSADKEGSKTDHLVENNEHNEIKRDEVNESKDNADKDESKADRITDLVEEKRINIVEIVVIDDNKANAVMEYNEIPDLIVNSSSGESDDDTDEVPDLMDDSEFNTSESFIEFEPHLVKNTGSNFSNPVAMVMTVLGVKNKEENDEFAEIKHYEANIGSQENYMGQHSNNIVPGNEAANAQSENVSTSTSIYGTRDEILQSTETGSLRDSKVKFSKVDAFVSKKLEDYKRNSTVFEETSTSKRDELLQPSSAENTKEANETPPSNKKIQRKHLSPLQTSDHTSPREGNNRKILWHLEKLKSIGSDDGSDKENADANEQSLRKVLTPLVENITEKFENGTLDKNSIEDIVRKISMANEESQSTQKTEMVNEDKDIQPTNILNQDTIDLLVQKYLTPKECEQILGSDGQMDTISKFDAVVDAVREYDNYKSAKEKMESKTPKEKDAKGLIKISWKDSNTVSFENVSADSVKLPTNDAFKKTDLRYIESRGGVGKDTDFVEIVPNYSTKEYVSDRPAKTAGDFLNISEDLGSKEDDDSDLIENFINSLNMSKKSGSIKSTRKRYSSRSESGAKNTRKCEPTPEDLNKLKSWPIYKQFNNMIASFLKQTSKTYILPHSDDELVQKIEQNCINFFINRWNMRSDKSKNGDESIAKDVYNVGHAYAILFRNLLGREIFGISKMRDQAIRVMEEMESMATKNGNDNIGMNLMEPQNKTLRNLAAHNVLGIRYLYLRGQNRDICSNITPDLFKTDHVCQIMKHAADRGCDPSSFMIDDDECLALDIEQSFKNLKPCGSVLLVE